MGSSTRDPLVSVCVTAYNYARFLPACVDSILEQSYKNIECIIIDDGSTDGTDEIVARYGDRIIGLRHDTSRGQLAAIITAFRHSHGQFISFIDADDTLHRDFVAANIAAHTSPKAFAAVSTSLQQLVDAEGHVLGVHPTLVHRPLLRLPRGSFDQLTVECPGIGAIPISPYGPQVNYAHQWLWGTMSSMMFRRDVLSLVLTDKLEGFRICADAYLVHFSHAIGGTLLIEMPLGAYRRHGGNYFADNLVIGGLSPLNAQRKQEDDPRQLVATQIDARGQDFYHALGPRRFVALIEKFCSLPLATRLLFKRDARLSWRTIAFFFLLRAARSWRVTIFRASRLLSVSNFTETP
jgi:glycosyltransferase involved in cell wall biosynthesis